MSLITNLTATTELEAVNTMLAAIGAAPITDLVAGQSLVDVQMATERLRAAAREVQSAPWEFNRRFRHPVNFQGQYDWAEPDGSFIEIYAFQPPANLAGFEVSDNQGTNQGPKPDLVIAEGERTLELVGEKIFYDRVNNREGLKASLITDNGNIFLDAWFFFDFDFLPETARRYITVLAARRFIAATIGSQELEGFSLKDEAQALRLLKRDQGDDTRPNMLDHPDVNRVLGGRPRRYGW